MASIERTSYPRLKQNFTKTELKDFYTPTETEILFVKKTARQDETRLHLLIQLKIFQKLGYFPNLEDVPESLLKLLRRALRVSADIFPIVSRNTNYVHQIRVLELLNVKGYDEAARKLLIKTVYEKAHVMDNPPDLINAAIEILIKENYELPAFSTIDRLAKRIRTLVNRRWWNRLLNRLTDSQIVQLEDLLQLDQVAYRTPYNSLKQLPKKPSLKHLQELLTHLEWLQSLGDFERILHDIPPLKIKHFAGEAKALDASEMKDFNQPKRIALLVCLIYHAGIKARDALAQMFIRRIAKMHRDGKSALQKIQLKHLETSEKLVALFSNVLQKVDLSQTDAQVGQNLKDILGKQDVPSLLEDCEKLAAFHGNNYFPLLWRLYRSHRSALFRLLSALELKSTSQDDSMMKALEFLIANENRKSEFLEATIDLSFAEEKWQESILKTVDGNPSYDRKLLEVCVFSHLAQELKSGDIAIIGSAEYGDYRDGLLDWEECQSMIEEYCQELGLPAQPAEFVTHLKDELTSIAEEIDKSSRNNQALTIDKNGELILQKIEKQEVSATAKKLSEAIVSRMPERNLLNILSNVEFHTKFTRHFGPLSGSDPKLEKPIERYLLTTFTYGCNLGSAQAARHMRGVISARMLSFVNHRHINAKKLDTALVDILDNYHRFRLPKFWGDGTCAAADGTKYDLSEQNLMAEYHIRYGGYGGIAYHHVSDLYIALFSHFIACGTWEAVYIIDGLIKNGSEIQPDTLHADTQGQSTTVFGLSYLLGIELQPRIRNVKDLIFYRPDKKKKYKYLEPLFKESIDWDLIETHWQDLMQVVLSIKAGKILPSTLLRKLGNYSRKNRLYLAYRELGRVIRTKFLLKYISDKKFREEINANTNKVEAYNGFSKWLNFGGEILQENDPEEQEKLIKYNTLIANALIFQNVIDQTRIVKNLMLEGFEVKAEDLKILSPYLTAHIKRFGDYVVDLNEIPP